MPASRPADRTVAKMSRRLARGDERAWRWLHDHYFALLHAAAISRGARPGDAADLVQRTYLRVLRHAKRFRTETDFRAWLCCLLRCETIDAARSGSRRLALLERFRAREDCAAPSSGAEPLHEALETLPAPDRDLLTRHYIHGWSQGELAAEEGSSLKAIQCRLARLRKRVRQSLENRKAC